MREAAECPQDSLHSRELPGPKCDRCHGEGSWGVLEHPNIPWGSCYIGHIMAIGLGEGAMASASETLLRPKGFRSRGDVSVTFLGVQPGPAL